MNIDSLYRLVQDDLADVERLLADVQRVEGFPELESMLATVLAAKGKRLRPLVALLAGRFCEEKPPGLVALAAAVELLHTATLIHDDVIDASDTRRGRPTANALYDNSAAVVLGDYVLASAAELITRTKNVEVIRLFTLSLMSLVSGELRQDLSAYQFQPDVDAYLRRIADKTASLFAASAGVAAVLGGVIEWAPSLSAYGENLGMAFQIVDDILDFSGSEKEMGKPVGSDLLQGTLTLPALLLARRHPGRNPVQDLFAEPSHTELVAEAVRLIQGSDILDEAKAFAESYGKRARESLAPLPATPARDALDQLIDFALKRRV